ncbi:astacin-like metalloendopeptidase [Chanodichthys erythropterus]|uniref:astacin-like metalloendopeptidase n=1 Tax=Chanodichthys erythropterus TaxID=933992 RepID=UPI00351F7F57
MMWFILLVVCFYEVQGGPVGTLKVSDIQHDEGHVNSLKSGQPHLRIPSEIALDFEEDYAVQEGDLLLPSDRNAVEQLWPGVDGHLSVPYEIDSAIEGRTEDILKALNMISEKTCIHFLPHTNETDYLHFEYGKGCASYVGCMGGEQPLLVGPLCKVGNICHEILHSLGLHHEHSRFDRDDHITIVFENIASGKEDNFMKKEGNTLGLKYDLESILHYGNKYFSGNGKPTILPKESGVKIGQRAYLSDLDVQKLRKLYHCDYKEKEQAAS